MPISLFPEIEKVESKKFQLPTPPITRLQPDEIVSLFASDSRNKGGIVIELPDLRSIIRSMLTRPPSPRVAIGELRKIAANGGFLF